MESPSTDNYQPTTMSFLLSQAALTQTAQRNRLADDLSPYQITLGQPVIVPRPIQHDAEDINLSDNARHKIERLFSIINKRLSMMPEMAQLKLKLEQPVLDKSREQVVMDKALSYADTIKLDRELAQRFIKAQMDIAKLLQKQVQAPSVLMAEQAVLHKQELRDRLITLTPIMLDALKVIQDDLELVAFRNAVHMLLNQQLGAEPLADKRLQKAVFQSLYPEHAH